MAVVTAYWRMVRRFWRAGIWHPDADKVGTIAHPLLSIIRALALTLDQFRVNRLSIHASGLSFFSLLSLVPLLAFLFLILKIFDVAGMVKPFLLQLVTGGNALLVERISEYIESTRSMDLGGVGFLTLFLIGFLVLQRVKNTLNTIWRVGYHPSYGYRFIEYVTVLAVVPLMLVATFSLSAMLRGLPELALVREWQILNEVSRRITPFSDYLVLWLVVYYAYAFLPDTRVRWSSALMGTALAGTGLAVAQNFYILVIVQVSNYNLVYGALALLPFLMVWFYVAWTIFLFGAELSCVAQNYTLFLDHKLHIGRRLGSTTPYFALLVLASLLRLMGRQGKAPRVRDIARDTGIPRGVVEQSLYQLVNGHLLTPVAGAQDRFVPREVLEPLPVGDVLERLDVLPGFRQPAPVWQHKGSEGLREMFRRANEALEGPLGAMTVGGLLESMEQKAPQPPEAEPVAAAVAGGASDPAYLAERERPPREGGTRALFRKK